MKKEKLIKKMKNDHPEFVDEVAAATVEELETRLSTLSKHRVDIEDAMDADEEYKAAKDEATELGAPYKDSLKDNKLRSRYIAIQIKERTGEK